MIGANEFVGPPPQPLRSAADEVRPSLDGYVPPTEPTPNLPAKRGRGRPRVEYSQEIAEYICDELGQGRKLHDICAEEGMPSAATVYRWRANRDFDMAFHCALLAKFDYRSEQCIDIADDSSEDHEIEGRVETDGGLKVVKIVVREAIERTKVRLSERHRQMAKELPRKYADIVPLPAPPDIAQAAAGTPGDNAKVIDGVQRTPENAAVWDAIAVFRAQDEAER